jgi:uncharacterized tellurite resistance protein B-like protein
MTVFDAIVHAMTTVATGGYSTHDTSIGFYASASIEWTAIAFMIIGGIPFVLYIQAVRGRSFAFWHDDQVRWFLVIIAAATLLFAFWLYTTTGAVGHDPLRHSAFTTISLITGTGYTSIDFGVWGTFATGLAFFLMCVGGCSGSTTGGIKVFRFAVIYQVARVQVLRLLQPSGVFRPFYNGEPVSDQTAISILGFIFVFALGFAVLALLLSFLGLDYLTAMSAAVTAIANVGPGSATRSARPATSRTCRMRRSGCCRRACCSAGSSSSPCSCSSPRPTGATEPKDRNRDRPMRGLIDKLFGTSPETEPVTSDFEEEQVAAASLLVDAGLCDGNFSEADRDQISGILERHFKLQPSLARRLLEEAETHARAAVEWHGFTRVVKEAYDHDERVHLIELLWEVALADEQLHDYEASLIRRICGLLYVSGRESAEARNRAKARLGLA